MGSLADATEQQSGEIGKAIHDQIRTEGPMRIDKDAGLFIAQMWESTRNCQSPRF